MFHTIRSTKSHYLVFQSLQNNGVITHHSQNFDLSLYDMVRRTLLFHYVQHFEGGRGLYTASFPDLTRADGSKTLKHWSHLFAYIYLNISIYNHTAWTPSLAVANRTLVVLYIHVYQCSHIPSKSWSIWIRIVVSWEEWILREGPCWSSMTCPLNLTQWIIYNTQRFYKNIA